MELPEKVKLAAQTEKAKEVKETYAREPMWAEPEQVALAAEDNDVVVHAAGWAAALQEILCPHSPSTKRFVTAGCVDLEVPIGCLWREVVSS